MFTLNDLPYKKDALEPYISKETINFHYGKHHQGYVDNLNKLVKGTLYEKKTLEEIIRTSSGSIYNNAAQVYNHDFYWQSMCGSKTNNKFDPSSSIGKAIIKDFSSFEQFKLKFKQAAQTLFGSGWVWLVYTDGQLKITKKKDANCPLQDNNVIPLLVLDKWEHAWYVQYPADLNSHIDAWWNVVNWEIVNKRYEEK